MLELADKMDSKSIGGDTVRVQISPAALIRKVVFTLNKPIQKGGQMNAFELEERQAKERDPAWENLLHLQKNPYPGRGIIVGLDETGQNIIQVYWLMGRSENSRNRVLKTDGEGRVWTTAADPNKTKDSSLIIYTAMRQQEECEVYAVSNGNQTDTIIRLIDAGERSSLQSFRDAMFAHTYEPDEPNFTPRISAVCRLKASRSYKPSAEMCIIRHSLIDNGINGADRIFYSFDLAYTGHGFCVTTYNGPPKNSGGRLPSFSGYPYLLPLIMDVKTVAESIWSALNFENRISLVAKFIHIQSGKSKVKIINKYKEVAPAE